MRKLYNQILELIETLDFEELYPGFKSFKFALYNQSEVILDRKTIPYNQQFIGNTAIEYDQEMIAIWNIEECNYNPVVLTSKVVHEMFHAWQYKNDEKRFPNELKSLDYQYKKENLGLKINETELLVEGYKRKKLDKIKKFVSLRNNRRNLFPYEVEYESAIETVEGMARFIEMKVLRQLDENEYQKSLEYSYRYLENLSNYLPIRMISYEIGLLMLLVAEEFKLDYYHNITKTSQSIYDLIFTSIPIDENDILILDLDYSFLDEYLEGIKNKISSILTSKSKSHYCDKIIGFNPLSSFKIDNNVYFHYFVLFEKDQQQKIIMNDCVGIINENGEINLIVEK